MDHFDSSLLKTHINSRQVKIQAQRLKSEHLSKYDVDAKLRDLLFIIECIDLTTLAGDDSFSNVARLCYRAKNPLSKLIIDKLKLDHSIDFHSTTAAVCVYPLRVSDCQKCLDRTIPIASVVAGFPCGQSPVTSTLNDITYAAESGAKEIDIVINRSLVFSNDWEKLYNEIKTISKHCIKHNVHLKVILSCGELGTLTNIYKASMCSMMAGADFIKTSTGKETINAKLVYGLVMIKAINDFYYATGTRVGLKPAGGIKTPDDALCWIMLVKYYLKPEWKTKNLFRIGASSLLNQIEKEIFRLIFKRNPTQIELL